jgi:predicted RNase H-like HicB family nuclease
MTISGRDGSPRYQIYEDAIVEVNADEDGWIASCETYPGIVPSHHSRTAEEALDAIMPMIRNAKDKETYGN